MLLCSCNVSRYVVTLRSIKQWLEQLWFMCIRWLVCTILVFICFMIQYAQKIFSLSSYFFELFNLFMQYWTKVMFYMYRLVANNSNDIDIGVYVGELCSVGGYLIFLLPYLWHDIIIIPLVSIKQNQIHLMSNSQYGRHNKLYCSDYNCNKLLHTTMV